MERVPVLAPSPAPFSACTRRHRQDPPPSHDSPFSFAPLGLDPSGPGSVAEQGLVRTRIAGAPEEVVVVVVHGHWDLLALAVVPDYLIKKEKKKNITQREINQKEKITTSPPHLETDETDGRGSVVN